MRHRQHHKRNRVSESADSLMQQQQQIDGDQQHEDSQQAERPVLFNGLINEKTIIFEPSPASEALENLCPKYEPAEAEHLYNQSKSYVTRICQELFYKLRVNNYRINYEAPFLTTLAHDFLWESDTFDVYIPIRLPIGQSLRIHPEEAPGLIGIKIPVSKKKQQQMEKDPLDFLKSNKRYVSSAVALRSTWKLVNNAMQQMSAKYGQDLIIQELSHNKEANLIDITVAVTSRYMNTRLASPKPGKSVADTEAEEEDAFAANAFAIHHDEEADDENVGDHEENEESELDFKVEVPDAELVQAQRQRSKRRKEPAVETKLLTLRLTPSIQHPSDEHAFLTPRPFSFLTSSNPDLWSVQYPLEEANLIDSLTRADRGLRVRAWRGLSEFCRAQSELSCVSEDMLKHSILHLAESEVDLVGIKWQRAPLAHYISDLLASLRDHLRSASLTHFFYKDINIMQCLQQHQMRSAALKIDFYMRKDNAFVRAIQRTIDARSTATSQSTAAVK